MMCDINTDWIIQMIVTNDERMERIEGTLERIEKLMEKLVEGKRIGIKMPGEENGL